MTWEPERYRRFEDERNRPVYDLIHTLGDGPFRHIVDLGCGPGNSTEALRAAYPAARISAIDHDPAMVESARRRLPGLAIDQAEIAAFSPPADADLLFSNAVFHWIGEHLPLLARLLAGLAQGGTLALQMPDNLDEPTHRLMGETALDGPWAGVFADGLPQRIPLPRPRDYVAALGGAGAETTVWRTTYHHRLGDADAIVDFVAGAGLRPFTRRIRERAGEALHEAFLDRYREAVAAAYPPLPDGSVLMAMPRLFVIARKRQ